MPLRLNLDRSRTSADCLPDNGAAQGHGLLNQVNGSPVRDRTSPSAAPLVPPAPATHPEASQALSAASLPPSGPSPGPRCATLSCTQPSLTPRRRSARNARQRPAKRLCRVHRSRVELREGGQRQQTTPAFADADPTEGGVLRLPPRSRPSLPSSRRSPPAAATACRLHICTIHVLEACARSLVCFVAV